MADSVTAASPNCSDCSLITVPATDPVSVLERLPERLFSRRRPVEPEGAEFPVTLDVDVFGPVGGEEPTPQYELARVFAQEKDYFRTEWRRAVALQHGLGRLSVVDGKVTGQCPHATGADLDRVGAQYGIGRPTGFTDCCYWRLILLLLVRPGTTVWLIRELCELYTGIRPAVAEEPAKLFLTWPIGGGESFLGLRRDSDPSSGWFFDATSWLDGDAPIFPPDALHGYSVEGATHDNTEPPPRYPDSFYGPGTVRLAKGLDLTQAVAIAKAAGIAVSYVNFPTPGLAGCYGATLRGPATGVYLA